MVTPPTPRHERDPGDNLLADLVGKAFLWLMVGGLVVAVGGALLLVALQAAGVHL